MPSKQELLERIRELEEENQELQSQLDDIADIVTPIEEDSEQEDDDALGEE